MANFKHDYKHNVPANKLLNHIKDRIEGLETYPFDAEKESEEITNAWSVEYADEVDGNVKELLLKRDIPKERVDSEERPAEVFHIRFKSGVLDGEKVGTFYIQAVEGYNAEEETSVSEGPWVKWQCVDETIAWTDRKPHSALHVDLNITNDRLFLAIESDPSIHNLDTRVAIAYAGETMNFEENMDNPRGNVLVTASCVDEEPDLEDLKDTDEYFGKYTSVGNNTLQMLKTLTDVRYQSHRAAFTTQAPTPGNAWVSDIIGDTGLHLEKHGFQQSKHIGKYLLSPIYITHHYDGVRGMFSDCYSVTKHNVLHEDTFVIEVDKCRHPEKEHDEEVYKYFDLTTEQNFFNTSPNRGTSLAVLSEIRFGKQVVVK